MSYEPATEAEADQPLDAIVYDVHPALAPPGRGPQAFESDYPYGTPAYGSQPAASGPFRDAAPLRGLYDVVAEMLRPLQVDVSRKADYVVPQRFGMSAILGIMTAIAVLFGGLRLLDASPLVYLFFGLQAIVICVAQMFQGKSPRVASAVAGAILLPLFVLVFVGTFAAKNGPGTMSGVVCFAVFSVPFGAFLGYLTGTCAAGVFLLMDALERYIKGQRPVFLTTNSTPPGAAP